MSKKRKPDKRSWIVRVRATVTKELVVEDCTEEQAREDPWGHEVVDEREVEQSDWDVLSVEPNE